MENSNGCVKPSTECVVKERENLTNEEKNRRSAQFCIYYSKYKFCKFGDNCRFLHQRRNTREFVSKRFTASRKGYEPKEKATVRTFDNPHDSNNKFPCRFYKAGHCEKNDRCLYSHSVSDNNNSCSNITYKVTNKNISRASNSKSNLLPICFYFKQGHCKNGDRCKFYHPKSQIRNKKSNRLSNSEKKQNSLLNDDVDSNSNCGSSRSKIEDANCTIDKDKKSSSSSDSITDVDTQINNFEHYCKIADSDEAISEFQTNQKVGHFEISERKFSEEQPRRDEKLTDVRRPSNVKPLVSNHAFRQCSSNTEILQLRNTEISQFKKRFPIHEVIEENKSFSFIFQPTDPDWPFDLRTIKLEIVFPEMYPKEICGISIVQSEEYICEILLKYLNQSISDWLNERHEVSVESKQVELIFRPFLKWFDRNLEDLFYSGLKNTKKNIETNECAEFVLNEDLNQPTDNAVAEGCSVSTEENQLSKEMDNVSISQQKCGQNTLTSSQKQGVKVLFLGLELIEGVAALTCTKITAMLQCVRCKTPHNIKTAPNRSNNLKCSKCNRSLECNFNPSLLHQFSNVLGTMHLVECQVVDINLVECAFLIDCLSCSKQVGIDGIHYGQKQKLWCRFCNQKLIISIESVKFQASTPTYTVTKATDKSSKKTEKKKDPLIKEGSPLPLFGACKHYKKSNRWLRFPCCGRVYPCDVCHEEKEMDHEMKFASRMICGFCSKEQAYSKDKPCISCTSGMVAKSGAHWEGGKGCRNQLKMASTDKHKYSGRCKTISKKAQNVGNKKK